MRKLGTIDLEILHLAIKENGKFNETHLENSELKRLGVGKILDTLGSLKDRKFISLNSDGSFTITPVAKEILWSKEVPIWAKILRLLHIKSCSFEQIADILTLSKESIKNELEKLRKNQLILMSPQRHEEKIIKIYEILPEGIEEIDKTEVEGFEKINFNQTKQGIEIMSLIDNILKDIQEVEMNQTVKHEILKKLSILKNELEI